MTRVGRWVLGGLLLGCATGAWGEQAAPVPSDETKRRLEEINERINALYETPIGRAWNDLQQRRNALDKEYRDKYQPFSAEEQKLWSSAEGREFNEKRAALYEEQRKASRSALDEIDVRAKAIYGPRHEALRKAAPPAVPEGRKLGFDVLSYPRIDGSTSTLPLAVMVACRLLGSEYQWTYLPAQGIFREWGIAGPNDLPSSRNLGHALDAAGYGGYDLEMAGFRLAARPSGADEGRLAAIINRLLTAQSSTHGAYVNLLEKKVDLALVARAPSAAEIALAKEKGIEIETAPIAYDALVFIVNEKNPIQDLSRQSLRDVFTKKVAHWKELGGPDKPLRALWREKESGSQELLEAMITGGPVQPGDSLIAHTMSGPFNRIARDEDAIGFSVYYYEHFMAGSPTTRVLKVDGVEPSAQTIASGKYPLVAPVYAAWRKGEPDDSPAARYRRWLTGPEGQAVVRESGYVPAK